MELQTLIKRMWQSNPTWGSPRIVAELQKLGIEVAKSTVEKYKPRGERLPSPTWRTFLELHLKELVAVDFFVVPTASFKVLFVFLVLSHDRRRIVHFNVTSHPTARWTAQQIVEAFPFDTAPAVLLRDGDGIYRDRVGRKLASLGVGEIVTAPASPWQNAYVERVIGSVRRELLVDVIVLNERHLKRLLSWYFAYYHPWRTHRSLQQDAPDGRRVRLAKLGQIVESPIVQGLHHYYLPKAA
jgi:transposase InsO family protein